MNAEEQERFLAALRRDEDFRAAVRRELFTKELLNLPQTVAVLVDAVAQQRQDLTTMAQEITQQRRDLTTMAQEITRQRQDFTALTQSVANYMERTLSAVKDVVTSMDAGFTAVQAKFHQVNSDLQDIRNQLAS